MRRWAGSVGVLPGQPPDGALEACVPDLRGGAPWSRTWPGARPPGRVGGGGAQGPGRGRLRCPSRPGLSAGTHVGSVRPGGRRSGRGPGAGASDAPSAGAAPPGRRGHLAGVRGIGSAAGTGGGAIRWTGTVHHTRERGLPAAPHARAGAAGRRGRPAPRPGPQRLPERRWQARVFIPPRERADVRALRGGRRGPFAGPRRRGCYFRPVSWHAALRASVQISSMV